MRPCPHSRSSLLYQSAQSPAAFLQSQPQPRKLQRGPSTPHEVRQSPPLHICSFSCHLYVYALSKNQGKFCTTLWACRMISQTERQRWSLIKKDLYKKKLACQKLCQCRCSHLILESVFPSIYIKSVLISLLSPHPLTHTHTSQTSSANQEADSDWPEGFHPAKTADYSCAFGSCTSSPAG